MGDLFDHAVVSTDTVMFAYECYREAVGKHPNTTFVVLAGNHDQSKDLEAVNSFDLFAVMVQPLGIHVVRGTPTIFATSEGGIMCCPYTSEISSQELVEAFPHKGPFKAVFGHWDLVNPTSDANMVPEMATELYVTGHDHRAREEERHGVRTICTGSMLAYAHGEGEPYRTVTLAELELIPRSEAVNLCLRIVLAKGEEVPPDLDALQITTIREKDLGNDDIVVGFSDGFDLHRIFDEVMTTHEVEPRLAASLFDRYRSRT